MTNLRVLNARRCREFFERQMPGPKRVYLVGPSGAGKSAIRFALQGALDPKGWSFPIRYMSRGWRQNDIGAENVFMPAEDFETNFAVGRLDFFWQKSMPHDSSQYYGFPKITATAGVYGCNSEFISNESSIRSHDDLFQGALLAFVYCSDEERRRRLYERYQSDPASEDEIWYRAQDADPEVQTRCDILLDNESIEVSEVARSLAQLVLGEENL